MNSSRTMSVVVGFPSPLGVGGSYPIVIKGVHVESVYTVSVPSRGWGVIPPIDILHEI